MQALGRKTKKTAVVAAFLGLFAFGASAQEDPPARVARLNYMTGNVSMEPAGVDDWAPAAINRPFTTGDYLYTDQDSQAELHMDIAVMRMGPQTSFGFLNVDDQTVQIKLSEGDMYFRVRNFGQGQVFEVDTPNAAVTLLSNGVYRFRVDPNGNMSYVVTRNGQTEITGGGQAFNLGSGQSVTLTGTDQLSYDVETAPSPDQFDEWCGQRDNHEARLVSARYLPPTVIGYEDLDDYGGWQQAPTYGAVWYPRQVEAGWAPYHSGHWAWVEPWGYTWVDAAPWGFAPFHYGRWAYVGSRWGWCPGPMSAGVGVGVSVGVGYGGGGYARPYYAPALVAFFGGSGFSAGISVGFGGGFGGGVSMGWVPLGYGEVYSPPYRVSQNYFRNVNVSNTTINKTVNITNVYNTTYVNKTVNVTNVTYANMRAPNAVMAMPQSAFASGRSVAEVARPVPAAQVARIQVASARVVAPPVAPTRQALMPTAGTRPAPRPAAQVLQRQVVAKATPPPPPASFAAKQSYLQQHAGQPLNVAALHQAVAPARPAVATVVRKAPPAPRAVQVHPGQVVGNAAALRAVAPRPAGRPAAAPAPAARPTPAPAPNARTAPAEPAARTAPAPAAHGAPPNARTAPAEPAARTAPTPAARPGPATPPNARTAPAEPAARPAPAAHGAPPNARTAPAEPGARTAPTPAARPEPATAPNARTAPAEPAERPAPAAHGAPPNARTAPAEPAARPAPATAPPPRNAERAQPSPAARPAERTQPAPAARPAERTQPAPAARPAERTQPAPAARPPERPAPEPARPAPAARPAPESRPTPPPTRTEARPAPPAHGTPPASRSEQKETKDTKDHPK